MAIVLLLAAQTLAQENTPQPQTASSYTYHYFKQEITLTLDTTRVAIFHENDKARHRIDTKTIKRLGLDGQIIEEGPLPGWTMIDTPAQSRQLLGNVESLLKSIQAENVAEYVSPVFIDNFGGPLIITRDILIGFDPAIPSRRAQALLHATGAGMITDIDFAGMPNVFRVRASSTNGFEVLRQANELTLLPEVRFAEPDMILSARVEDIPNDPDFAQSWALHNTGQTGGTSGIDLDAPEAWDITTGDPSVIILVMDFGVQQDHPEINQVPGADFTIDNGDGGPLYPCDNHGTLVAGCITGIINNNYGSGGVAPDCKVASARIFRNPTCSPFISLSSTIIANALDWGELIGAKVSNSSFVLAGPSSVITSKYQQTYESGMIHFAASGNDSTNVIRFPASAFEINAVGAVDHNGNRTTVSNYGYGLDFVAPGDQIFTTDRTGAAGASAGDFTSFSGTSAATAFASGVAALVISQDPTLNPREIKSIMMGGTLDLDAIGYDPFTGFGMVNALGALTSSGADCNNNGIADYIDLNTLTSPDCNGNDVPDECDVAFGVFPDCNNTGIPDSCDIADGTSLDCNLNGVPDECDIASGENTDCDVNGVPDECELGDWPNLDCNTNGIIDSCDIDAGTSLDCNLNGNPDECEQDCNANGLPDDCDVISGLYADCDHNLIPDECEKYEVPTAFATDGDTNGWTTVALHNEYMVLGDPADDTLAGRAGAAFVYKYDAASMAWDLQTKLLAPDGAEGDNFGKQVAIHGDVIVIDANSGIYVFRHDASLSTWNLETQILPEDISSSSLDQIAVNDNTLVIGSSRNVGANSITGTVYVYRYDLVLKVWNLRSQIFPPPTSTADRFGSGVAIAGDLLVIGAKYDDDIGSNTGSAFVYQYDDATQNWVFVTKLLAPDGEAYDRLGDSVDTDGKRIVVGAPYDSDISAGSGAAYVYRYNATSLNWDFETKFLPIFRQSGREFGRDVAVDGDSIAVANGGTRLGRSASMLFSYDAANSTWLSDHVDIVTPTGCRFTGGSVAVHGEFAAFGTLPVRLPNCFTPTTPRAYVLPRINSGLDCNANGIFDACDIDGGASADINANAVPDECENLGDTNGDGSTNIIDLLNILINWGSCFNCEADIDRNGEVNISDLLSVLISWD